MSLVSGARHNVGIIGMALGALRAGQSWTARCQTHDDGEASLSNRDADGKVLLG